jgi:cytochrome c oxidase assembly factor CtaG
MQKAKAQCTSHLAAMALLRVVVGCLLVLAAAAEGATPMTVTFQARKCPQAEQRLAKQQQLV